MARGTPSRFAEDGERRSHLGLYVAAVALRFTLFVLHATFLGDWIIDDAGISYS